MYNMYQHFCCCCFFYFSAQKLEIRVSVQTFCTSVCPYNPSLCCLSEQPPKGDDRRHTGTVEEEERGHTLQAQTIFIVTQIERCLPFDVHYQTAE